ncbi:MAG: MgtC/SapB family protein [Coprobacillus sp.]
MEFDFISLLTRSEWVLRIVVAAICGCLIGYERSSRNKEAGIRTHAIIALGAALIMVVSKYGFQDMGEFDSSRVAAQIVSGVGFLGAGIIFVRHGTVSGLTTAAGMWATSGVGMCIGSGLYDVGVLISILIIGLQALFHNKHFLRVTQSSQSICLEVLCQENVVKDIQNTFKKNGVVIHSMKIENLMEEIMHIDLEITGGKEFKEEKLLQDMMDKTYIKMFSYS